MDCVRSRHGRQLQRLDQGRVGAERRFHAALAEAQADAQHVHLHHRFRVVRQTTLPTLTRGLPLRTTRTDTLDENVSGFQQLAKLFLPLRVVLLPVDLAGLPTPATMSQS